MFKDINLDGRRFLGTAAMTIAAAPLGMIGSGQSPGAARGTDVDAQGNGPVTEQRLYQLIRQPKPIAERLFEIEFRDAGVKAFAFTFG